MNQIEKICKAAAIENSKKRVNELSKADEELALKPFAYPRVNKYIINLNDEPVSLETFLSFNPNIRATLGCYTIQYIPSTDRRRNPKFPYLIGQDLIRMRVLVSGPDHWYALGCRIPEIGWLCRNSTLTYGMFRVAKRHPGLVLRFSVDYDKYCDKITKRAEELGVDINNKPLVSYCMSADTRNKYKDYELSEPRSDKDYASVLNDINNNIKEEEKL